MSCTCECMWLLLVDDVDEDSSCERCRSTYEDSGSQVSGEIGCGGNDAHVGTRTPPLGPAAEPLALALELVFVLALATSTATADDDNNDGDDDDDSDAVGGKSGEEERFDSRRVECLFKVAFQTKTQLVTPSERPAERQRA